jgi:hypothetical protein
MAKKTKQGREGGRGYEIGRLIDQSGGMNNAVYPALLNDNEAKLLKNATLDEKGTVKTCKGRRERFAEKLSQDPVNGITAFYPDTATSRLVIGAGTKLYKDMPHLVEGFDGDWEQWTGNGIDKSDGNLKIKLGDNHLPDITHASITRLEKEGNDLIKTEAEISDFQGGITTNLVATINGLELGGESNTWNDFSGKTWEEI